MSFAQRFRADAALSDNGASAERAAPPSLLAVEQLSVNYDQVPALRGIDVVVGPGEFVALLGPNGAGKTTLLRTISGVVRARSGRISFAGRRIDRSSGTHVTAIGVAHVPEARRIFPQHTVYENLQLGGYTLRRQRARVKQALDEVFDLFPVLAQRRDQPGGTLSGGEAQMLAMARAMMSRPRLLMLDEPSLGLAPLVVRQMFEYLARLHREEGLAVLLVEQAAAMALSMADRAYVLTEGRVVIAGTAAEVRADPHIQEAYLGGPSGRTTAEETSHDD